MYWDNDSLNQVGTSFNLNQVTEMGFTGGLVMTFFMVQTKDSANVGGNNAADLNADTPN